MPEASYFDPLYDCKNNKSVRSLLKFETVFGEPGCYIAFYVFIAIFHTPLFLLLVLIFSSASGLIKIPESEEYIQTSAQILSCIWIPDSGNRGVLEYTYEYTIPDASNNPVRRIGQSQVSSNNNSCLQSPQRLIIKYLETDPSKPSIVLSGSVPPSVEHGVFLPVVFAILYTGAASYFSIMHIWQFFRAKQKWLHLQRTGIVCHGVVVKCRRVGRAKASKTEWIQVNYSFTSPEGNTLKGKQVKMMDEPSKPAPGTPLAIFYTGKHCHVVL